MKWRSVLFSNESRFCLGASDCRVLVRRGVVKAPKSEGVVDPKSGERRLVSLLLSGSRGRKNAPKGDSSRCVWRKQTVMSVRDNI
ncbi:hypothetical protein TNCV_2742121 [Trichonephila clavipes]|nr:hypothetical protein TNCV_2742121 [Trichonephila clavipes]